MTSWLVKDNPPPKGIVCKPMSTDNPNGFGDHAGQFVKFDYTETGKPSGTYERDEDDGDYKLQTEALATKGPSVYLDIANQVYVRRELPDTLKGGNCNWVRAVAPDPDPDPEIELEPDGLVLSWHGPTGFNLMPDVTPNIISQPPPGRPGWTRIKSLSSVSIKQNDAGVNIVRDLYTWRRWQPTIYAHGVAINAATMVLGVGMIDDVIVVVCAIDRVTDRVYYGKYSDVSETGWKIAGDIDMPEAANLQLLDRQGVYSFSDNGLNAVSLLDAFNATALANKQFKRVIVRLTLAKDAQGDISFIPTFETINHHAVAELTTTQTEDISVFPAPPFRTLTHDEVRDIDEVDMTLAIGFQGSDEKLLSLEIPTYTATYSQLLTVDGDLSEQHQSDKNTQENSATIINFLLDGVVIAVSDSSRAISEIESYSNDSSAAGSSFYDLNRTTLAMTNVIIARFSDISSGVFIFSQTDRSDNATTTINMVDIVSAQSVTGTNVRTSTIPVDEKLVVYPGAVEQAYFNDSRNNNQTIPIDGNNYLQYLNDPTITVLFGTVFTPGVTVGSIVIPIMSSAGGQLFSEEFIAIVDQAGVAVGHLSGNVNSLSGGPATPISFSLLPAGIEAEPLFNVTGDDLSITGELDFKTPQLFRL